MVGGDDLNKNDLRSSNTILKGNSVLGQPDRPTHKQREAEQF